MALLLVSSCLHVRVSPEQIKKGICIAKYSFITCHSGGARFFLNYSQVQVDSTCSKFLVEVAVLRVICMLLHVSGSRIEFLQTIKFAKLSMHFYRTLNCQKGILFGNLVHVLSYYLFKVFVFST